MTDLCDLGEGSVFTPTGAAKLPGEAPRQAESCSVAQGDSSAAVLEMLSLGCGIMGKECTNTQAAGKPE